jgi:hypothetical protein
MVSTIIRIGLFVIPWLTIFFIPKNEFKKYTPVTTFASLLVLVQCILSNPFRWWTVKGGLLNKALNELSFIFGPFFVGTIWIFRFTFGKFWRYAFINLVMDAFLAFPANWIFQKFQVYKLVNFKPKHIFFTSIGYALIIYGYQLFIGSPKSRV